jgi:hypothetical protein
MLNKYTINILKSNIKISETKDPPGAKGSRIKIASGRQKDILNRLQKKTRGSEYRKKRKVDWGVISVINDLIEKNISTAA